MNRSGYIVINSYNYTTRLLIACLLLLLTGCATQKPDLGRLYESHTKGARYHPVIVIHGFMGSRLRYKNGQEVIWPPDLGKIFSRKTRFLALPIDEKTLQPLPSEIEPYALFDELGGIDFYHRLIDTLEKQGNFRPSHPGELAYDTERRYYILAYDWREDVVKSATRLDELIEKIRRDYRDPNLKVDIVAHSMGGLITRYYSRYGTRDVLDSNKFTPGNYGGSRIHQAVLMGTPNLGSSAAVYTYVRGFGLGSYGLPPEVLTTMPSIYQLFPHPKIPWLIDINGRNIPADLHNISLWKKYQWGLYNPEVIERILEEAGSPSAGEHHLGILRKFFAKYLKRGQRFARSLSVYPGEISVEYVVFGGDCDLTPANILVEYMGDKMHLRDRPEQIINPRENINYDHVMMQPGDGRVTKPSLLARQTLDPTQSRNHEYHFPYHHAILFCERHSQLTGNIHFQNNLLDTLLANH